MRALGNISLLKYSLFLKKFESYRWIRQLISQLYISSSSLIVEQYIVQLFDCEFFLWCKWRISLFAYMRARARESVRMWVCACVSVCVFVWVCLFMCVIVCVCGWVCARVGERMREQKNSFSNRCCHINCENWSTVSAKETDFNFPSNQSLLLSFYMTCIQFCLPAF